MFTEEEIREIEPAPLPIIDYSDYFEIAKKGEYKIGVIAKDSLAGFSGFKKGEWILYRPYRANEAYGRMLYDQIKIECNHCTTCRPYRDSKGKLTTASTCVYVPLSMISHEIKVF